MTHAESPPSLSHRLMGKISTALKLLGGLIYQKQVTFQLPTASMRDGPEAIHLPKSFLLRSICGDEDNAAWVNLLNKDAGFGHWDEARLKSEIHTSLVAKDSAGLLFKDGQLVGSAAVCFARFGRKKVPTGMFLIMDPAYRGNLKIAKALLQYNMWLGQRHGHQYVFATTDPNRLPALMLYLSNGAQARYTNLWSFVQWRRIYQRLGPTIDRVTRRQSNQK